VAADWFRGQTNIRTNPATVNGTGYVHAAQVGFPNSGDFVAIGTSNGLGVPGSQCGNDYDPDWSIYTDGKIAGEGFCVLHQQDVYQTNDNPSFSISRGFCPSASATRWLMSLGGVLWACYSLGQQQTDQVRGILETTGGSSVDRDIDVRFNGVEYRLNGASSFQDFGNGDPITDDNYMNDTISSTRFWEYKDPMS
jgi:hypothetical protein